MKRVNLNNLYESPTPPADISVLWVVKDYNTGDIKVIHRYKNDAWEPYLVSVDYLMEDSKEQLKEE